MPAPSLTEIATTTLRNRTGKLADNVSKNNALLMKLNEAGTIKTVSGGRTIVQELDYTENVTFKRYSGYETLDISQSETFSAAEFDWKQAAVAVSISGLEMIQNSGKEAVINLLGSRIINAERTFSNNISTDCYSDGTADGSKQIGGLQLLVADTPTSGTVGGIARGSYTFWRNLSFDATTDGGAAVTSANIQRYMNRLYSRLYRGSDRPNVIIADNNYFTAYEESLQAIQRITNDRTGKLGFSSYQYKDCDVIMDGGFNGPTTTPFSTSAVAGGCPVNHMYFLNTKYIHFRPYAKRNMELLDPETRASVNQDAMVRILGFAGNMTLSCAFLQGVIKD
jgi:hypothetical protein